MTTEMKYSLVNRCDLLVSSSLIHLPGRRRSALNLILILLVAIRKELEVLAAVLIFKTDAPSRVTCILAWLAGHLSACFTDDSASVCEMDLEVL